MKVSTLLMALSALSALPLSLFAADVTGNIENPEINAVEIVPQS